MFIILNLLRFKVNNNKHKISKSILNTSRPDILQLSAYRSRSVRSKNSGAVACSRTHSVKPESEKSRNTGGVVVAAGMSKYVDEKNVAEVFRTADKRMYKNKEELKR